MCSQPLPVTIRWPHLGTEVHAVTLKSVVPQLCHDQTLTCAYHQGGLLDCLHDPADARAVEVTILQHRVMRR
jgi:hypothetical protein